MNTMLINDIFEDVINIIPGCYYISDLRPMVDDKRTTAVIDAIKRLKIDNYNVKQWNELHNYLLKSHDKFNSSQEAYQSILTNLNEK